jgi:hypothetical protein
MLLKTHGLHNAHDVVIDVTPSVLSGPNGTIQTSRPRSEEIRAWLNYTEHAGTIDAFVVFDDELVDMDELVQTTTERRARTRTAAHRRRARQTNDAR